MGHMTKLDFTRPTRFREGDLICAKCGLVIGARVYTFNGSPHHFSCSKAVAREAKAAAIADHPLNGTRVTWITNPLGTGFKRQRHKGVVLYVTPEHAFMRYLDRNGNEATGFAMLECLIRDDGKPVTYE